MPLLGLGIVGAFCEAKEDLRHQRWNFVWGGERHPGARPLVSCWEQPTHLVVMTSFLARTAAVLGPGLRTETPLRTCCVWSPFPPGNVDLPCPPQSGPTLRCVPSFPTIPKELRKPLLY